MRNLISGLLFAVISILFLTPATNAFAQAELSETEVVESLISSGFGPGTIDFTLSAGLGGLIYPNIEPGIDIGLIPLGGNTTFSVGGTAGLGYCLLCGIVSTFSDLNVSSWYTSFMGRGLIHTDALAKMLETNDMDLYFGAMAGPNFYVFSVSHDGSSENLSSTIATVAIAPLLGIRLVPENSNWLFFAEGRVMFEFGFSDTVLKFNDGTEYKFNGQAYSRGGLDLSAGIGYRF